MAKRLINETIVLARENKQGDMERIVPPIGKNFDLTADEIESIESVSSTAISKADSNVDTAEANSADNVSVATGTPETEATRAPARRAAPAKDEGEL